MIGSRFLTQYTVSALIIVACFALTPTRCVAQSLHQVQQQLIHAVIQDQVKEVPDLLRKGGDPNMRCAPAKDDAWILESIADSDSAPPLMVLACRFGGFNNTDIVQMLLDKGGDVNIADKQRITPLMVASQLGFNVSLLLKHGAKVNVADRAGKTPLMYAMNNLGLDSAAKLLAKGADINARDKDGQTTLMKAIEFARFDPIRLYGEDLKAKEIAAKANYIELVSCLLEHNARLNVKDKAGNTALTLSSHP